MGQPRKRLRFTEWIQADKARQPNEGTSHEHDQSRQIDTPQNAMDSMNLQVAPSKDGGRSMRSERPSAPKDVVKGSIGGDTKRKFENIPNGNVKNQTIPGGNLEKNMFQDLPMPGSN